MNAAIPFFPLPPDQRDLAFVGLAQVGTPARAIAAAVEVDPPTVCEVLNSASIPPILPPRTFRFENIEWDTDGAVVNRLPGSGEITVEDCEELDDEDVEYRALNGFSGMHGYCIESCRVTEVPGAAWPTTPEEADGLVMSANWTGELRMGTGRYALVTHETLALRYPEHLAYRQRVLLCGDCADADPTTHWAFNVIDTQNVEGLQSATNNVLDQVSRAMDQYHAGYQEIFDSAWEVLVAMGLKHVQAPEHRKVRRTFELTNIRWAGKRKKTRHLPTSGEIELIELEDSQTDAVGIQKLLVSSYAKKYGCAIESCMGYEVFYV